MDILKLKDMYDNNKKFKEYVDKYSKKHGIIYVEYALKCMMVQNYAKYLIKEGKNEHWTNESLYCWASKV